MLSIAISVAVLAGMMWFTGTPFKELWATLRSLSPWTYLAALACHLCTYSLRAMRFWVLIPKPIRPQYRKVWVLGGAHNMATYLLPAKTGEASWIVYVRRYCGVPSAPGIASLVVSRLLDAAVLASSVSIAVWYLGTTGTFGRFDEVAQYVSPLGIIGVLLVVLAMRGDLLVHLLSKLLRFSRLHHWELGEKIIEKVTQIAHAMRRAGRDHSVIKAVLLTIPVWFFIFAFYAILARGMDIDLDWEHRLSFPEAVFGSSLAMLANLLPINGAAGAGTQELGWVTGFKILGVEQSRAFAVGLAVHFVQLFNVVSVGMFAHFVMRRMDRPDRLDLEAIDAEAAALEAEIDNDLEAITLKTPLKSADTAVDASPEADRN